MTKQENSAGGSATGSVGQAANAGGAKVSRKRKEYDHELTAAENYALQTVQRASSALRTINDAIRSGKTVNPEVIELCFDLSKAAGDMLFAPSA